MKANTKFTNATTSWFEDLKLLYSYNNLDSTDINMYHFATRGAISRALDAKQDALVSGTNIKTINGNSLLGSGDLSINSVTWGNITGTLSNQTDLQTAIDSKINTSNVAIIESSSTASNAYSSGDFLVYGGQLYEVISDIAIGEMLTPGTNIYSTTVANELFSLKEQLHTNFYNYDTLKDEFLTINTSIIDTSKYYSVEI